MFQYVNTHVIFAGRQQLGVRERSRCSQRGRPRTRRGRGARGALRQARAAARASRRAGQRQATRAQTVMSASTPRQNGRDTRGHRTFYSSLAGMSPRLAELAYLESHLYAADHVGTGLRNCK